MFRHIVVPLDGSRLAAQAVPYAVTLARAFDARLSLLAVVEPLPPRPSIPDSVAQEADERRVATATAYLTSVGALPRATGLGVTTAIHHGNPAEQILVYAEAEGCDLIAMASHGRTGLERLRMGSVAQHVLRHASVPTLVVPAHGSGAIEGTAHISGVTVTLDGSALAEMALPIGSGLAARLAVPLTLLRIMPSLVYLATTGWDGGYYYSYPVTEAMERDEERAVDAYLQEAAMDPRAAGVTVRTRRRRSATNRAEMEIADALRHEPDGIAVMASHGRGGVLRWALGSTAEGVLDQASGPVLIVRAGAAAVGDADGATHASTAQPIGTAANA